MTETNGHAPSEPTIEPGPLPMSVGVIQVQTSGGDLMVVLRFSTPAGNGFYFLSGEQAIEVGALINRAGQATKSGLSLPPARRAT